MVTGKNDRIFGVKQVQTRETRAGRERRTRGLCLAVGLDPSLCHDMVLYTVPDSSVPPNQTLPSLSVTFFLYTILYNTGLVHRIGFSTLLDRRRSISELDYSRFLLPIWRVMIGT